MKTTLFTLFSIISALTTLAQTAEPVQLPITYPNAGTFMLEGTLTLPADLRKPVPVVLLIAGSGPTDRDGNGYQVTANTYRQLADSLARQGVAVLRYDKRLIGKSRPADLTKIREDDMRFAMLVDDAVGLIGKLRADKRFSNLIVAGHSEGALVGMLAARQTKPSGYISLAGPGRNSSEVLKEQLKSLPDTLRRVAYQTLDSLRAGRLVSKPPAQLQTIFRSSVQPYLISWLKYDPAVELKAYTGPVLIIQGKHDKQVGMLDAENLKAARADARLVVFDTMSHILKNAPDDTAANLATYSQPQLPLMPGLTALIADFAQKPR